MSPKFIPVINPGDGLVIYVSVANIRHLRQGANIGNTLLAGAGQQGNALMAAGTARASRYAGAANAVSGGAQNWMLYNLLQRQGLQGNYDAGFT